MGSDSVILGRLRRLTRLTPAGALAVVVLAFSAPAAGASTLSSNWAGWVALPASGSHETFTNVSGSWVVPKVSCSGGQSTYSAVWVGLGGYRETSDALEQIGIDADCSRDGNPHYDSWYELIPAGPVNIPISVHAGDEMTASVTVRGDHVTMRLRDLTTGTHYSITRHASQIDISSADWILEAPSSCSGESCQTLPLADFGGVSFTAATATSGSHTGPVEDPLWSSEQIELRQGARPGRASFANGHVLAANEVLANASAATGPLGAFSVGWSERQPVGEAPRPRSFGEATPLGE
jgi:Peptidase A4 family